MPQEQKVIQSTEETNEKNGTSVPNSSSDKKGPSTQKLKSIMEAASALTSLGDEETEGGSRSASPKPEEEQSSPAAEQKPPKTEEGEEGGEGENAEGEEDGEEGEDGLVKPVKRFIPDHKKPDAALTFPEKLMNMMNFALKHDEKKFCIAWLPDGKSFVIRNPDEFTRKVLPKFFKATKFSSFTRKLYRWGFRQVNRGIGPDDPIIFGNEYFQRDNAELMVKMRSITAAGTRKAQSLEAAQAEIEASRKRPFDSLEEQRKRMFLESLMQQKAQGYMGAGAGGDAGLFGQAASLQQSLNLASALRPSLGLNPQQMMNNMKPFGLLNQFNPNTAPANALNLYMAHQQNQNQQHQNQPQSQGPQHQLPQQQTQQPPGNSPSISIQQQIQQLQQQQQQLQHQQQQLQQQQQSQYSTASTAEIVNAAINALRYAA